FNMNIEALEIYLEKDQGQLLRGCNQTSPNHVKIILKNFGSMLNLRQNHVRVLEILLLKRVQIADPFRTILKRQNNSQNFLVVYIQWNLLATSLSCLLLCPLMLCQMFS